MGCIRSKYVPNAAKFLKRLKGCEKMRTNLYGEEIVEKVEEDFEVKRKKTSPFDFIKSVSETKEDMMAENPDIEKDYVAFIVNKGLGYFPDTVLYANEMNLYNNIPAKAQYNYYLAGLRKRKRFSKWHKLEDNPDLDMVKQIYGVRSEVAKGYLNLLSEDELKRLRELTDCGESKSNK